MQTGRVCIGKSREEIVTEVAFAFSAHPVVAVQVGYDIVRVTFRDTASFKLARVNSHVAIFGKACVVQGGDPPPTMIHLFDYPAELGDDPVRQALLGFGDIKSVRHQKYIGRLDIETGTRLVLMAMKATPPRLLPIGGYFCRLWYRAQPLVCNLCNAEGHKSADCPNKDKCRHCGQSGHFVRSCPNPWRRVVQPDSAASADFPALTDSLAQVVGVEPPDPPSVAASTSGQVGDPCESFLSAFDLFGDIASISDDSDDGTSMSDSDDDSTVNLVGAGHDSAAVDSANLKIAGPVSLNVPKDTTNVNICSDSMNINREAAARDVDTNIVTDNGNLNDGAKEASLTVVNSHNIIDHSPEADMLTVVDTINVDTCSRNVSCVSQDITRGSETHKVDANNIIEIGVSSIIENSVNSVTDNGVNSNIHDGAREAPETEVNSPMVIDHSVNNSSTDTYKTVV